MSNFLVGVLTKLLSDPKVQQLLKNLLSDLITEKIAPLIPLAAASAARAFADLIPGVPAAIEDVVAVANTVRDDLNKLIPDLHYGIPMLDALDDVWRH